MLLMRSLQHKFKLSSFKIVIICILQFCGNICCSLIVDIECSMFFKMLKHVHIIHLEMLLSPSDHLGVASGGRSFEKLAPPQE